MFYTKGYYLFPNNYFTFVELMINRVCWDDNYVEYRQVQPKRDSTPPKSNVDYNIQYSKTFSKPNLINWKTS